LEGILAGLSAAILVAIAHSLTDLVVGQPLRTPATLSTLFFEAEDGAGVQGILLFSALHVSFWVAAGVASAYAIAVADAHPRVLRLVFVVLSFAWVSVLYLSGAISPDAMGSMRLWLGTLIGAAVVVGTLVFRHPRLLSQPERDRLTDASRSHLQQAFRIESESLAAAQEAVRSFAAPVFIDLAARKSAALAEISAALARLEIEPPSLADAPPVVDPITLQSALRRALSRERDAVKSYDAFLASTDERALRRLLLDRRFEAFDENLPSLEAALREQDPPGSGEPPDDPISEDGSGAT
jgi:hypothetical protein